MNSTEVQLKRGNYLGLLGQKPGVKLSTQIEKMSANVIFKELERNRFDALMGVDDVGRVLADRLSCRFKVK